jgi:glycerol-3-phosphate cytidylyltransferase-like family protein
LQEEFPDMSQSIIGDILNTCKGDRAAAAAALGGIDKETKIENDKKIKELRELFPFASEQDCKEVLASTNWDVEAAIVPLFNRGEELKQKARKEKEADLVRKRETEAKKQSDNLLEIFNTIPKDEIQRLLDENEGDIEETTNQLLVIVAKQDEEKAKKKEASIKAEEKRMQEEQEMRLRELKIQALEEKFEDLAEKEVILALEAADWDIKKAHLELMKVSAEKKKKYLKSLFPSVKEAEIENALDSNEWDKARATTYLTEHLREKRSSPVVVKKVSQNVLLERSMVSAQQLEEQISQSHANFEKALKEESMANFKKDLEHIMKVQARHGVAPGMAPPLPKQIDNMLGKHKPEPVEEHPQIAPIPQPQPDEPKIVDKPEDGSKFTVILSAPSQVDVGNSIPVTWEMTKGESTPYDWIGMFSVDQPNKQYITYQWREKNDTNKGTITFTAPNLYGTYEFRYFVNRSYQHVAMSNRVTVGPKVELEAKLSENGKLVAKWNQVSGNKYPRAWIGLYERTQTNNKSYITWEYATTPEVTFTAPIRPREYEFRFFTNSYEHVAKSNAILIEGEDRLSASIADGIITVKPHIVSVDPYYDAVWVGIFFTTENDHRQWRRYKYISDREAEVTFKAPKTPGEYEVRLFANKSYDLIVKSGSFAIEKK